VATILTLAAACSGGPPSAYPHGEHHIQSLILYNLQARRPVGASADPKAEPGEREEFSQPKPDARLDCQPIRQLLSAMNPKAIRACLQSLDKGQRTVEYTLRREIQPYFALDLEDKGIPQCLKDRLPRIPVPREIVFQAPEEQSLRCYASALDLEKEKVLGVKIPFKGYHLKLDFPGQPIPKEDGDLLLLIATWSLTPFFDPATREIVAKLVPETACRRCFTGSSYFTLEDAPGFWPPAAPQ
jgi:hypothetical protein